MYKKKHNIVKDVGIYFSSDIFLFISICSICYGLVYPKAIH